LISTWLSHLASPAADNYEFLSIIDKPKAGVTYKVRNLTTGNFETLRTLPGASYGDPESLERFLREIKTTPAYLIRISSLSTTLSTWMDNWS
jgi:hypothetical protein